ncbi:MAG: molybdenum cofactor guanylyltransferase MobA [Alphaproteobacteria bacterium]|nr:molybdenum cofactor guanylyltransferase MobA [Alphaproteobacteria bacterium]MBU1550980.1 molybdenum cofactor guanylyltransferase MobA [Alphaproteobacteria bacterium]MBU2339116.1 molybdenum cofactor guanylyltransferase MobA [Alphaproteobacteria bacterium]MBU2387207.1 molybdenum cofactor guanylyltransferase MobA [Alphaproteobacteria bacterium]
MTAPRPPALILAGGRSSRMGSDKLLLPFGKGTLLAHILARLAPQVSDIALNASPDLTPAHDIRLVPDTVPGQPGPLAGVLAGLRDLAGRATGETHLLTVPSDVPFFASDLVARLQQPALDPKGITIAASDGRTHPVFGLWPVALADDLEDWIREPQNRRMSAFLARHPTVAVPWDLVETPVGMLDPFMNVNTPADIDEARRFLEVEP